jgi:pyruvate dehydrogenase complex dehydrogenase (E1) component
VAVNTEDPYAFDGEDIDPQETTEWVESLDAVVD